MNIGVGKYQPKQSMPMKAAAPAKEFQVKEEKHDIADRFNESRDFGNSVAGVATGFARGAVDGAVKALPVTAEIVENLWQAETVGINLKVLGTLAAPIGGALSAIASPLVGAYEGSRDMGNAGPGKQDSLNVDKSAAYTDMTFNGEQKSFSSELMSNLEELGDQKLREGQKPYDVPILSPAFAVIGGVVSGGISGVVGLVAGLGAGLLTTSKEIAGAVNPFGESQSIGERAGRIAAAPLFTATMPYGLVKEGLIESVPRGLSDGWKHGPLKPVSDTIKSSVTLAGSVLSEAWER